jgi:hypothetical protein
MVTRKMTEREVEAFKKGRDAFHDGTEIEFNPHIFANDLFAAWRAGWIEGETELAITDAESAVAH